MNNHRDQSGERQERRRRTPAPCASRSASVSSAMSGRNTSWPVAELAASMPMTRPRRCTNQRVATVAASTMAVSPVPTPTTMPQSKMSCHTCVIASDAMQAGRRSATSAQTMTRRTPKRFMNAAANGPNKPNSKMRSAKRGGNLRVVPAELVLQRHDQHAGRAHRGGGHQHGEKGDGRPPPSRNGCCGGRARRRARSMRHFHFQFAGPNDKTPMTTAGCE